MAKKKVEFQIHEDLYRRMRRESFAMEVKKEEDFLTKWPVVELSVSRNGNLWMSISFTAEEWQRIRPAVDEAVAQLPKVEP